MADKSATYSRSTAEINGLASCDKSATYAGGKIAQKKATVMEIEARMREYSSASAETQNAAEEEPAAASNGDCSNESLAEEVGGIRDHQEVNGAEPDTRETVFADIVSKTPALFASSAAAEDLDDLQGIVIDNGSGLIKAGFSGDDNPRSVIPNMIGRPRYQVGNRRVNKVAVVAADCPVRR